MKKTIAFACALLMVVGAGVRAQKPGPKIFISADMEGIWGVVHAEQTSSTSPEYGPARKWMAEDVNAVVAGLFEAGAGEVVVNDSHGSMRNIVADALNPRASLISGSPKPLSMMQGVDATFDAVVLVGYHARAGTAPAILDHTISGGTVRAIRINGQEMPELGINAAIAGYYKVPVILLTGDTETCAQAKSVLGEGLVTAAVKEATGRSAARMYPAEDARRRLKEAAKEALAKRQSVQPFRVTTPATFELEFHNSGQAEMPLMLPGVKRTGARGITFTVNDYLEGFKLLRAAIALGGM
ncbi:MAG: M55 family metallopeptidase [Bacteroidales bacterium]